jgi:hypothetical protein
VLKEFVYMPKFNREWSAAGFDDEDLRSLESFLMDKPDAGPVMAGTGGLRKLRWKLPNRGKRGGVRVLYLSYLYTSKICMVDLFPKDEKDNLTAAERNSVKKIVKQINEELGV